MKKNKKKGGENKIVKFFLKQNRFNVLCYITLLKIILENTLLTTIVFLYRN